MIYLRSNQVRAQRNAQHILDLTNATQGNKRKLLKTLSKLKLQNKQILKDFYVNNSSKTYLDQ